MKRPLRYLSWIVTVPLGFIVISLAVSFAVSNLEFVGLELWPLPSELPMPLYLPILLALLAGFIAGGTIAWWTGGKYRRLARRQGGRLRRLTTELESLRASSAESDEAEKRKSEAERLKAAAQASEVTARREAAAPRQLASHDS